MNDCVLEICSTCFSNAWRDGRKHQVRWAGQPGQIDKVKVELLWNRIR